MPEVRFAVRLTPRGGSDHVDGVNEEGALLVRVAAPPADGGANLALLKLLATELGLPRTAVRLVRGATSRVKGIAVEGIGPSELTARWPRLAIGGGRPIGTPTNPGT